MRQAEGRDKAGAPTRTVKERAHSDDDERRLVHGRCHRHSKGAQCFLAHADVAIAKRRRNPDACASASQRLTALHKCAGTRAPLVAQAA